MPNHRKRRRKKRSVLGKKGLALFIGVSLMMLVLILTFIVPSARRQNISTQSAILMSVTLWVVSVYAVWACLKSRRRRYKHGHSSHVTERTGYSELEDEEETFSDDEPDPHEHSP